MEPATAKAPPKKPLAHLAFSLHNQREQDWAERDVERCTTGRHHRWRGKRKVSYFFIFILIVFFVMSWSIKNTDNSDQPTIENINVRVRVSHLVLVSRTAPKPSPKTN